MGDCCVVWVTSGVYQVTAVLSEWPVVCTRWVLCCPRWMTVWTRWVLCCSGQLPERRPAGPPALQVWPQAWWEGVQRIQSLGSAGPWRLRQGRNALRELRHAPQLRPGNLQWGWVRLLPYQEWVLFSFLSLLSGPVSLNVAAAGKISVPSTCCCKLF